MTLVAFLVQSHRGVDQLARLVGTLLDGSPDCVVHLSHDRRGASLSGSPLLGHGRVYVDLAEGGYGDFSHVRRYLDGVDRLRREGLDADWYVNLTGQDYPLRPAAQIVAELAATTADAFLEYFPVLDPGRSRWPVRRARSRYWFHHRRVAGLSARTMRALRPLQVVNRLQPWARVHVSYGLTLGWRVQPPFGAMTVYGGSAYWTLSRGCVDHLLATLRERPDLAAHYRGCLSPEESIVQTILLAAQRFTLVNDPRRYFDFAGTGFNHPRLLSAADVPAALASQAHFARKFDLDRDPVAFELLDRALADIRPSGSPAG